MTLRARVAVVLIAALSLLPALTTIGSPSQAAGEPSGTAARSVTVTGKVVMWGTRRPVRNIYVAAYDAGERHRLAYDYTASDGRFSITGIANGKEEFGIYVRGSRYGLQNGWVGCNKGVKATFAQACTFSAAVGLVIIKKA
ncbi:hypothetical protein [Nocardioides plantarum]|uniref:Carboxypeptidase regulatory-like domain-containing protein n=1 Tax=Nocardioides plantarum TaxID=29299 RepID=A0ABV5KIG7_9ACTN|nr:hypothetical protein [Nocardioides plantarum]